MLITFDTAQLIFKICIYITIGAFVIYLPRLYYYIEGFKKPKHLDNPEKNRLAVLVPARNEKGVVHLMDSLAKQTYDQKYFDCYIIVQDKKDPAIELCKSYKNMTSVVVEKQSCKGDALDGALQAIKKGKKRYAGYIIVDADNIVDENFVLEMNNSLLMEADVILGKRCVKNFLFGKEYRNWVVNCNGLIYTFLDKLGNCFRCKHAMYASICGTGIMVTGKLIEELGGWPFRSITEDYELAISSLTEYRRIVYYEPAITYTEESLSHKSANERRKRWLLGYAQVNNKYGKAVFQKMCEDKTILKDKNLSAEERFRIRGNMWGCFDFLYSFVPLAFILAPAVIAAIIFGVCAVSAWLSFGIFDAATVFFAKLTGICLLYLYLLFVIYTIIGLIADRKYYKISFLEKVVTVLVNPFYTSEYAAFFANAYYHMAKGMDDVDTTWVSIERIDDKDTKKKRRS